MFLHIKSLFLLLPLLLLTTCGLKQAEAVATTKEQQAKKQSIVEKLKQDPTLTIDEQIALYHKLKKESREAYNFENEDELTMYGYSFLWGNNITAAIKIFKLIVAEFNSPNSYDSLGEAYLNAGNKPLALLNYKKALELNPDNFNAEDQVFLLENPGTTLETPREKFDKIYTISNYKEDLDQLGNKLLEVHPNALKFISKEDFWKLIDEKKALLTAQTTYAEFIWHCSAIVASVNCSHTSVSNFFHESEVLPPTLRFPLQVRWVNEHLYVIDPLSNAEAVHVKDEILRINGMPVAELLRNIYTHISSQGYNETSKTHFFNSRATALIPYALHFPQVYTVTLKQQTGDIRLKKSPNATNQFGDPSTQTCEKQLCLEITDQQTAVLTIASFNYYPWNNLKVFTDFIDSSMRVINESKIKHLIVDVRGNGGGSMESSIHLLRYLTNKSFAYTSRIEVEGKVEKNEGETPIQPFEKYYKGKLYFLIDGQGNSTTGHFMSLVKVWKLGPVIGEELGSNQFCSAGQAVLRLSNTKLLYYAANNTHVSSATGLNDAVGILPDYTVTQDIDAYVAKRDVVKEFALNLIAQKAQ